MESTERRNEIMTILSERTTPISASALAQRFGVTRQIIVKDMALLKAKNTDILSTSRGYVLRQATTCFQRMFHVCHRAEEMEDELNTIVDLGGHVLTTAVNHPFYGTMGEMLNIKSRRDVQRFLDRLKESQCEPLLRLTNGRHMHLVEADEEETLDEIEGALKQKGYLIFE